LKRRLNTKQADLELEAGIGIARIWADDWGRKDNTPIKKPSHFTVLHAHYVDSKGRPDATASTKATNANTSQFSSE
jgi:hypothetical protein